MMLARVCRVGGSPALASFLKTPVSNPFISRIQSSRLYATRGRTAYIRQAKVAVPAGPTAFEIGKAAVASGAVIGFGALCYYGLGLSPSTGTIDTAIFWPKYVKDRIKTTYMYMGGSLAVTALSAAACLRIPALMNLLMHYKWVYLGTSFIAMWCGGVLLMNLPYKEGLGTKQLAWLGYCSIIGAVIGPWYMYGMGQAIRTAALYTAGMVGGLSTIAISAPSEKFLNMGAPLAIGLGVVAASCVGSFFFQPTTVIGSGFYSMALYGGLILFSALLLHDTQKIIKQAETYPAYNHNLRPYDPINNAISVYLDVINIFVRILAMNNKQR